MNEQSNQPRNLSEKEQELIQRVFSDDLLRSMRAVMLNLDPTETDKETVKNVFAGDEIFAVIRRRFYPTLSRDSEIGQVQDVWIGVEQMVFGQSKDTIYQAVAYKEEALKMTEQALQLLKDPTLDPVDVSYTVNLGVDPFQVRLLARNQFIRHVEQQLLFLKLIADQKKETTDQEVARKKQDSNE